jgi:hypothetical protein
MSVSAIASLNEALRSFFSPRAKAKEPKSSALVSTLGLVSGFVSVDGVSESLNESVTVLFSKSISAPRLTNSIGRFNLELD